MAFDVVIVGGGPAGAWAGYRLARAGARVAIVDGSHPREKPCGGGVTGRALDLVRAALDAERVASVRIASALFAHREQRSEVALDPEARGLAPLTIVARRDFDGALLEAAERAGASLIRDRAVSVEHRDSRWRVLTRAVGIEGDHLFGADGANSLVRRTLQAPFPRADLSIATGCFVSGVTERTIAIAFEDNPPGYLWSFPRTDHLAVGICAQADESSSAALLARAEGWIRANVPSAASLTRYSWPIPSLSVAAIERERTAAETWFLLGDAAGLVDPITREGIYFALRSADLAASAVLGGNRAAAEYATAVRDEILDELIRAARIKARFFNPHFTALLLSALNRSSRIRGIMGDLVAGRQEYRGLRRRLVATMEFRLMLELFGLRS